MQLFLVTMKNVQTDINHQPWNLISALFTQHFDPLSNKETRRKQQSNSKMQNSWLTIKTGKMSSNKSTFSLESSVIKVLQEFSSKALFSVCLYFSWLHVWIACKNRRYSSLITSGGVSPGGTSVTQQQKFHTDDVKSVQNPVISPDWTTE